MNNNNMMQCDITTQEARAAAWIKNLLPPDFGKPRVYQKTIGQPSNLPPYFGKPRAYQKAVRQKFNAPISGVDFWRELAAGVTSKPAIEITKGERNVAKCLAFHLMYGTDHKLLQEKVREFVRVVNSEEEDDK